jgi:hypothetical protein
LNGSTGLALLALAGVAVGCRVQQSFAEPEPGLERMLEQPRLDPFEGSKFYRDGLGMRPPPSGTIPVERESHDPKTAFGIEHGVFAERVPVPVDRPLLERGRERFDIVCAACHGITGTGESVVAENMDLRRPPSLHEPRIRAFPPGRLYRVIHGGYGMMPSYAAILSEEDRWGVVAYVRALQLGRNVRASTLPPEVRAALEREAP